MEIKIEDLEVGDEILIACQSHMKYLTIVRKPAIGKAVHWRTKVPLYKSVKCSSQQIVKTVSYVGYNSVKYTRDEKEWILTGEDHNIEMFVDLSYRTLWLVKRNGEKI